MKGALFRSIFVFVIIELGSRRVVHVNVTRQPTDVVRPRQGIHPRIPCDPQLPDHPDGEMVGVPVLGGLHRDYRRKTA